MNKLKFMPLQIIGGSTTNPETQATPASRKMTIKEAETKYEEKVKDVLKRVFKHDAFRQGQREVVFAALAGSSSNIWFSPLDR
jgi:superfamily II DNA helicase RecQ